MKNKKFTHKIKELLKAGILNPYNSRERRFVKRNCKNQIIKRFKDLGYIN